MIFRVGNWQENSKQSVVTKRGILQKILKDDWFNENVSLLSLESKDVCYNAMGINYSKLKNVSFFLEILSV